MKIRGDRATLAEALAWVGQAISKSPSTPALAGIHLSACDGELVLSGFNYDRSHSARVEVVVADDGECLVSGHFLREVVTALKGEVVELVLDSARLEIHSGRSTYRISTLRADDFPKMPGFPKVRGRVALGDLAAVLGTVEHAASRNDKLAILTAVNLKGAVGTLAAAATDRFRVARRETLWEIADGDAGAFEANVPMAGLTSALKGMDGAITIGAEDGMFGLADTRRKVTVRCLAEEFPKVDQFLAPATDVEVDVEAVALAEAVKRASMAAGEHQIVRLAIAEDGEITVTADSETSEGAEFVECSTTGVREVAFNGAYLAAALLAAESERVRLGFHAGTTVKPVTVTPIDGERIDLIVMPRRNQ